MVEQPRCCSESLIGRIVIPAIMVSEQGQRGTRVNEKKCFERESTLSKIEKRVSKREGGGGGHAESKGQTREEIPNLRGQRLCPFRVSICVWGQQLGLYPRYYPRFLLLIRAILDLIQQ